MYLCYECDIKRTLLDKICFFFFNITFPVCKIRVAYIEYKYTFQEVEF